MYKKTNFKGLVLGLLTVVLFSCSMEENKKGETIKLKIEGLKEDGKDQIAGLFYAGKRDTLKLDKEGNYSISKDFGIKKGERLKVSIMLYSTYLKKIVGGGTAFFFPPSSKIELYIKKGSKIEGNIVINREKGYLTYDIQKKKRVL